MTKSELSSQVAPSDNERIRFLEERTERNIGRVIAAVNGFTMKQSETDSSSYSSSVNQSTASGATIRGGAYSYAGVGSGYSFDLEIDDNQAVRLSGGYDPFFGGNASYAVVEDGQEVIGASFGHDYSDNIKGLGELKDMSATDTMERFALDTALLAGEHGIADRNTAEGILEDIRAKRAKQDS